MNYSNFKNIWNLSWACLLSIGLLTSCTPQTDYSTWDANDDDLIESSEFNTGFAETPYYNDWDMDNDGFLINGNPAIGPHLAHTDQGQPWFKEGGCLGHQFHAHRQGHDG